MSAVIAFMLIGCLMLAVPQVASIFGKLALGCFFVALLLYVGAITGTWGLR